MAYNDLRQFLDAVENKGEIRHISGAHWNLEMSSIDEIVYREGKVPKPILLFDDIPDYPNGYRTLFGLLGSTWRIAHTLGLPEMETAPVTIVRNWYNKVSNLQPIPPKVVSSGPVQTHSLTGRLAAAIA